jgi:predicted RNA-binding protein (virulence factor B family)
MDCKEHNMREKIQEVLEELITKHQLDMYGEELDADIHQYEEKGDTIEVVFNDEYVGYLIAGYVASHIYDEMEENLKELGLKIVDSDGSWMMLEKV